MLMNENQRTVRSPYRNEIGFWGLARLLLNKFYLLLLAGFLCAAFVFAVLKLFVTPTYESHASFYVYNNAEASHSGTINNTDLQAAESLATTYSKILESNSVLDSVIDDLGGNAVLSRKTLSKYTDVAVISDTQLLKVTIRTTDAYFSQRVAQAFVNVAPTEIVRITKAGGVEVVDRPEVATEKTTPRTAFDIAVGFIVGVVIISLILVLRMVSDTTIYLSEEVENITDAILLGEIPIINTTDDKQSLWIPVEGDIVIND
jgi:capsular polysaccharide biosynthesis protein